MLEDCEKRESKLSDWERSFIDSMTSKLARGGALTRTEDRKLEEIWERVT